MVSNKGKEVAEKYSGKGKRPADSDKAGGRNKRNRGTVQFFEDAAYEVGDDDDDVSDISGFGDWDFFDDEFEAQSSKVNCEPGKALNVPVFPKEEELSGEELEHMVEERYGPGSSYVTYTEDRLKTGVAVDGNKGSPSYKEPTIWKVKCMIGREKQSVFCLMQKYVEFNSLGNKLRIISAFSIEHVKGFIYIEANKQSDINEACKGVSTVYTSRIAPIPKNEVSSALSVRSKSNEVSVGSWARVKNGRYKGDLAQVIAVNDSQRKATVKLIPRIDLQMLAEKYGGGVRVRWKRDSVPAPRLVTSTELEEFRPLIQHRRDRESGLAFEVLDGMMLKDGYLYKKISMDSLNLYGVLPTEDELLKFESPKNEVPDCQEWLTELYGEKKKELRIEKNDKGGGGKAGGGKAGGGKGEGSSSSGAESNFEVNDLVLFNRKDFGVIIGSEKEEYYRVLREGSEGPLVVVIDVRQLKKASFENRLTALDKHKKMISINDTVRILEGPLEGRQGNVKHIYRGIIFFHDEVEQENNGYFCCKSQICEKVKLSDDASKGKDGESSFPSFDDPPSSPKSPLAPEKPWETRGRNSSFNAEDKEGMFTVGQSLRIRVGPLKGYLCRVLAIRRTDVTVKLDSQHKILTVKAEHLAEVRGRSSAIPMSDDKDAKPFDLLGNPDGSADWMTGAGTSADGERSSWPAFPSSGTSAQPESGSAMETDNKVEGDGGWGSKVTPKPSSTWGNTVADEKPAVSNEQAGSWGNGGGNWGKTKTPTEDQAGSSQGGGGNWGNTPKSSTEVQGGSSQDAGGNWGSKPSIASSNDASSTWGKKDNASTEGSGWGKSANEMDKVSSGGAVSGSGGGWWGGHVAKPMTQTSAWGKSASGDGGEAENKKDDTSPGWGKTSNAGGSQGGSWGKNNTKDEGATPAWSKKAESSDASQGGSWGKSNMKSDDNAPAWGKTAEASDAGQGGSWGKSNSKNDDSAPAWGKMVESPSAGQGGSWGKSNTKNDESAPAWGKKVESPNTGQGGSWDKSNTKNDESAPAWGKKVESNDGGQGGGWGKSDNKKDESSLTWGKKVESSGDGQGGNWGNSNNKDESAPAWGKKVESTDGGQGGSWGNSYTPAQDSQGGGWSKGGGSSWGKQGGGGSSWGGNNDGGDQKDAYDGGRGGDFGGRRGRGGWRGGGRGGRSFGDDDQGGERGGFGGGRGGGGWSDRGGRGGWRGGGRGGRSFGDDDQGGGRNGGDRGSFRGRGRSDWGGGGGFGGRGRGRRDETSDWGNNQNDSGNDRGQNWGSSGGGSGGGGGWSKGNDGGGSGGGGWGKGNDGGGSGGGGWGKGNDGGGSGGGGGWSKGNDGGGSGGGVGWSKGNDGGSSGGGGGSWSNKGSGSSGNWNKTGSADAEQPSILGAGPGSGGGSWNKSGPSNGSQSSGWGTPKGGNEGGGSGSGWGKGNNDGGSKGGW